MGLFSFFAHRASRKSIQKTIDWYRELGPDKKAGMIFYVWLTRGINLAEISGNAGLVIPVYYYKKGAEAILTDVIDIYKSHGNIPLSNAANHHFYTNLAVSYPDEGYGSLVREMWNELLSEYTALEEVIDEMVQFLNMPDIARLVENNDVSIEKLVKEVNSIKPHFMVNNHPLSIKLLEEEKLANSIF
jgi:hypothetical protein